VWEIDGNVRKEIEGKKLMTFHLLPRSASRARDELGARLTGKLPDLTHNNCRDMYIVFVSYPFLISMQFYSYFFIETTRL